MIAVGWRRPTISCVRAGDCRLVITGSYHAAVFALSQGVSVVALVCVAALSGEVCGLKGTFCGAGLRIVELERADTMELLAAAVEEGWRERPVGATGSRTIGEAARSHKAASPINACGDMVTGIGSARPRGAPIEIVDGRDSSACRRLPWICRPTLLRMAPRQSPASVSAKPKNTKPRVMSSSPLHTLSADEIETFRNQGFLGPFTAFDPRDMERARDVILERVVTTPTRYCPFGLRVRHLDSRTVYDLCSAPAIVGRMASLYGPDLVLWDSNLFNAEPDRPEEYPWHQDHYSWNMEPVLNISAWLAIGPATEENGCVEVIPGSHRQIVPPVLDADPHLSLRFGGVASNPTYVDETKKISLPLESGQFFLFTERLLHHLNPNRTRENRLGLAVRVTVPIVKVSEAFPCMLLSGEDRMGFNRYVDPPPSEPDAEWLASLPTGHRFEFDRPVPGIGWHFLENRWSWSLCLDWPGARSLDRFSSGRPRRPRAPLRSGLHDLAGRRSTICGYVSTAFPWRSNERKATVLSCWRRVCRSACCKFAPTGPGFSSKAPSYCGRAIWTLQAPTSECSALAFVSSHLRPLKADSREHTRPAFHRLNGLRSVNGIRRGRRGFGFFFPFRRRHQALPLPLPHEFFILGGAGSGRRVGRQAPGPVRESIGDPGREPLVDAAASAQRARGGAQRQR
jgi:hypothetical protein